MRHFIRCYSFSDQLRNATIDWIIIQIISYSVYNTFLRNTRVTMISRRWLTHHEHNFCSLSVSLSFLSLWLNISISIKLLLNLNVWLVIMMTPRWKLNHIEWAWRLLHIVYLIHVDLLGVVARLVYTLVCTKTIRGLFSVFSERLMDRRDCVSWLLSFHNALHIVWALNNYLVAHFDCLLFDHWKRHESCLLFGVIFFLFNWAREIMI